MPTGYTADVQEGKVTDFATFAMQCARAFGACVDMRDDPMDAPIPETFEADTYHSEHCAQACDELRRLLNMNFEQITQAAEEAHTKRMDEYGAAKMRKGLEKKRYEDMLAKVRNWEPPSPEHEGLKDFMMQQLADSIKHDIYEIAEPTSKTPVEWYIDALQATQRDIDYHTKERNKDFERAQGRTEWLKTLRASLETHGL